jgi:hypothetical protein
VAGGVGAVPGGGGTVPGGVGAASGGGEVLPGGSGGGGGKAPGGVVPGGIGILPGGIGAEPGGVPGGVPGVAGGAGTGGVAPGGAMGDVVFAAEATPNSNAQRKRCVTLAFIAASSVDPSYSGWCMCGHVLSVSAPCRRSLTSHRARSAT